MKPYVPRPIRFLELREAEAWRLKIYGIDRWGEPIPAELADACFRKAILHLSKPAEREWDELPTYGIATLIVHVGADACFGVLGWWTGENMLRTKAWSTPLNGDIKLQPLEDGWACVWEMAVLQHERAAWLRHVYRPEGMPDWDAYLADTLTETL